MGHRKGIVKRPRYVDRLTISEVAIFVGIDATTLKSYNYPYGSVNDHGWRIYTVSEACQIFEKVNGRMPRASEAGKLMLDMGMESQELHGHLLQLFARRVIANQHFKDADFRD